MQPGSEAAGPGTARLAVTTLFVGALLFVGVLYATNAATSRTPWINHDVGYHSYLGLEMAEGERLYVDLKEDNPPGSPLLLGQVARIGRLVGLPGFLAQHLLVLLLGAAGLAVLWRALPDRRDDLRYGLVVLAYLLVVLRGTFSNSLYQLAPEIPYDFGQREHLFSLLFVPYLLLRILRREMPRAVWPLLLLLGFVSTFKPFWPPLIAVVELYRWIDRRQPRWWITPLWLVAGMTLPLVLLALHSPASLARFLGENIPMYLRGAYTHYDTSYAAFLATPLHWQMVGGAVLLLGAAVTARMRDAMNGRGVVLLLAVATIAYLSVVHQHKFWSYHTMVYFATTVVPAVLLLGSAVQTVAERTWRRAMSGGVALALCLAVVSTVRDTGRMLRDYRPLGSELVELIAPYEKIMYFSMSVVTSYAPLLLGKHMVGPYTVFVDLPELLALPDDTRRERVLNDYAREVRRVIERERPELLVFSPERLALRDGVTMHGFLREHGAIPQGSYRRLDAAELSRIDPRLAGWPVYRRVDLR